MNLGIRLLAVGVLHCSLPARTGSPWLNHSTTATSGSLCCHFSSFQRSLATSSRCSRCRRGHCACRRAEHLATHSFVSITASPYMLLFRTVYAKARESKQIRHRKLSYLPSRFCGNAPILSLPRKAKKPIAMDGLSWIWQP